MKSLTRAVVCICVLFSFPSIGTSAPFAYIANSRTDTVSVIDTATNTVIATVPVGLEPWGVAVHPNGSRVYVTNGGSGEVSVIDTATNTVIATLPGIFPSRILPRGVAVHPDGSRVYVAYPDRATHLFDWTRERPNAI
ncbi:MAG: hypothetical protein WD688_00210, partial [Candidatus Binatia bacterium]